MSEELTNCLANVLREVSGNEDGKELMKEYGFTFQFSPTDGEPFYVEIKGGEWDIVKGTTTKIADEYRPFEGSSQVLLDIVGGKRRLVDAVWEGDLRAETYGYFQCYVGWFSRILKQYRALRSAAAVGFSPPRM
ncbi:MAG: hypothetical protein HYY30_08825 [Chloroflexi bacterium]|nr:hypothetical protein [Chloroflexota bacterium]